MRNVHVTYTFCDPEDLIRLAPARAGLPREPWQVFKTDPSEPPNSKVDSAIEVVTLILALVMSESAIDSLQNGISATISSTILRGKPLSWARGVVVLINVLIVPFALANYNVLSLFLSANMLGCCWFVPILAGGVWDTPTGRRVISETTTILGACGAILLVSLYGISDGPKQCVSMATVGLDTDDKGCDDGVRLMGVSEPLFRPVTCQPLTKNLTLRSARSGRPSPMSAIVLRRKSSAPSSWRNSITKSTAARRAWSGPGSNTRTCGSTLSSSPSAPPSSWPSLESSTSSCPNRIQASQSSWAWPPSTTSTSLRPSRWISLRLQREPRTWS
jgi:hypothetical protein